MPSRAILLLQIVAAFAYAGAQVLTRRLGDDASPSVMAIYLQGGFIAASALFWIFAGDGRYAAGQENESAHFLLRAWAWAWPPSGDWGWFLCLGLMSAVIAYSLSQAHRSAAAATIAPFEYVLRPLSILWGRVVFDQLPDAWASPVDDADTPSPSR